MNVQLKRWTREEYEAMVARGILAPESHVQLLDGEIIQMTSQGALHRTAVTLIAETLRTIVPSAHHVQVQARLAISYDGEPEPDVAVIRGGIRDYVTEHPATAALVIEVADTSLDLDRRRKKAAYARAGIPEYWILNLPDRRLEVHRDPEPNAGTYRTERTLRAGDEISPASFPTARILVSALLP
jgi:Uma2 family endonuclease